MTGDEVQQEDRGPFRRGRREAGRECSLVIRVPALMQGRGAASLSWSSKSMGPKAWRMRHST